MKKLFAVLMSAMMLVCFMPTMAWAAEGNVAEVTADGKTTQYETLAAAIEAVPSDGTETTVKLLQDAKIAEKIVVNDKKNVILDLNGHSVEHEGAFVFQIYNARFHVTGTGSIFENATDQYAPIWAIGSNTDVENYTVITIDNGVTLKGDYAGIFVATDSSGKYNNYGLVINMNGKIDLSQAGTVENYGYCIYINGNNQQMNGNIATFNLNGAKLLAGSEQGIYAAGYAKWNITDSTIESDDALSLKAGEFRINGGEYISNGQYVNIGEDTSNGAVDTGAALSLTSNDGYAHKLDVTVESGTFTSKNGHAVYEGIPNKKGSSTPVASKSYVTLNVKGGTFNSAEGKEAVALCSMDNKKVISAGTFSSNPKEYVAEGANIYKYNDTKFVVSATAPAHSDGKNTWIEDKENGYYTETYVSYSSGSATTDNVTNKSENTTTGEAASTTADINASTTTKADGTKTTTATVDNTTAGKIVDKAVANKSEEVVVDATSTAAAPAAGTTTEVALPEKTVQDLAAKTDANVTIKTDAASVALDKEAVDAVAAQAGTTGTVKLVVETVKTDADIHQVELKLVTSNGAVTDFKGGNVAVTIKLDAALNAKDVVCVYIDDNGVYHKVNGQKNADGTYTFTTGHFSTYAVMSSEEAETVFAQQDAKAADMTKALKLTARSAKTSKGNIKVTLKVNADEIKALEDLGYTVTYKFYRSTKKAAAYTTKVEKTGKTYTNTTGKTGTRYYYKARVMVYSANGTLVAKTALNQCKYACRIK